MRTFFKKIPDTFLKRALLFMLLLSLSSAISGWILAMANSALLNFFLVFGLVYGAIEIESKMHVFQGTDFAGEYFLRALIYIPLIFSAGLYFSLVSDVEPIAKLAFLLGMLLPPFIRLGVLIKKL